MFERGVSRRDTQKKGAEKGRQRKELRLRQPSASWGKGGTKGGSEENCKVLTLELLSGRRGENCLYYLVEGGFPMEGRRETFFYGKEGKQIRRVIDSQEEGRPSA